jgi:hypothetical protein
MKPLALSLAMALLTSAALAQQAPLTETMTCAQAQSLVASRGVITLYTSARTWDQFVPHQGFCVASTYVRPAGVRTRDNAACPLQVCTPHRQGGG